MKCFYWESPNVPLCDIRWTTFSNPPVSYLVSICWLLVIGFWKWRKDWPSHCSKRKNVHLISQISLWHLITALVYIWCPQVQNLLDSISLENILSSSAEVPWGAHLPYLLVMNQECKIWVFLIWTYKFSAPAPCLTSASLRTSFLQFLSRSRISSRDQLTSSDSLPILMCHLPSPSTSTFMLWFLLTCVPYFLQWWNFSYCL